MDSDILGQLYSVEPEQFVAARKRLERSLRHDGRAEEAAEIAKLRKPSQPVFLANRLARWQPDLVAQLIDDGERLAAAHQAGDPKSFAPRNATLQAASTCSCEPFPETCPMRSNSVSPCCSERQRAIPPTPPCYASGVLSEEIEPAAFDALAGMTLAAPKARSKRKPSPSRLASASRGRFEMLESQRLREAERELRKAEADHERAARRVAQLESSSRTLLASAYVTQNWLSSRPTAGCTGSRRSPLGSTVRFKYLAAHREAL